ncbi:MAG: hypothetical protein LLG08_03420, partial [Actinomycetia bacterium]|nr:hypothetical protein [Actinomycetes bacterium]
DPVGMSGPSGAVADLDGDGKASSDEVAIHDEVVTQERAGRSGFQTSYRRAWMVTRERRMVAHSVADAQLNCDAMMGMAMGRVLFTRGEGLAGGLYVPGLGVSGSVLFVSDAVGHFGLALSGGWYGSTCWGLGVQRQLQYTTAASVANLRGRSWAAGASGGEVIQVGAEVTAPMNKSYAGFNVFAGAGLGAPFESHISIEDTAVFYTSCFDAWQATVDEAAIEGAILMGGME